MTILDVFVYAQTAFEIEKNLLKQQEDNANRRGDMECDACIQAKIACCDTKIKEIKHLLEQALKDGGVKI